MAYYKDLREYLKVLEEKGKLVRIKREINKDTELHPLVRWQLRGLPEKEWKAFLFENVIDAKGKKYDVPVVVGAHAISTEVYALAMMCEAGQIPEKWKQAQLHPLKAKIVSSGPVHEEVHMGDNLLEHGGLEEFPIPISTPGFDNAPYLTAGNFVSKDPDTGVHNVGNYRGMIKSNRRIGCQSGGGPQAQHHGINWWKHKEKGLPKMPVAVAIGPTPVIGLVATVKVPYETSEYDVAGGITGEPVELVRCKTVDLLVPAAAEVVIEGEMPTDCLEVEGPFGEAPGYMGLGGPNLFLNVTCITHRKKPIWNCFISQKTPSESGILKGVGGERILFNHLRYDVGLPNLVDVYHNIESAFTVLSLRKPTRTGVWRALKGAELFGGSKIIITVDDDIDPRDWDSVNWALSTRMQPEHDVIITKWKTGHLDPSAASPEEFRSGQVGLWKDVGLGEGRKREAVASALLIDATLKWDYPPVSLPKKEFMERARKIWEEEGLPPLTPKVPWYGYSLGYWTKEDEEAAELAVKGEYYKTGEKLAKNRKKV